MKATRTQNRKKREANPARDALLDRLISQVENPQDLGSVADMFQDLKKGLLERMLQGELTHHLGYEKHHKKADESSNHRNGYGSKQVILGDDQVQVETPRDRHASFEPAILPKGVRRLEKFDENVLSMYARGMSVREIQGHLQELYAIEISRDVISTVTDEVVELVEQWQRRPLEKLYCVVYLDCLYIKTRHEGSVHNRAYYVALGYTLQGQKEVLGIWVQRTEGARFWMQVLTELKQRGVRDILIACVDGLKGFSDALESVFPQVQVQTCIVHQMRYCQQFVPWKERKEVTQDLKSIYRADNAEHARSELEKFKIKWDKRYPMISKSWESNWDKLMAFMDYPPSLRKMIYTTNAIESLNMVLRKSIKNRGHFPSEKAAIKLLYLAIDRHSKKWTMPPHHWHQVKACFYNLFEDRIKTALGENWMR